MSVKGRVAFVHDWLNGMRGGEKVLEILCELFPQADIYTLFYIPGTVSKKIEAHRIIPSSLSQMPFTKEGYRYYLPLMPKAVEWFDLSRYDLVISSSHCVAKGAAVKKGTLHICYCHTPMRYIWDQFEHYFGKGRSSGSVRFFMNLLLPYLRSWDQKSSQRVDHFIANSQTVQTRIQKYYSRNSTVIVPPVDTDFYTVGERTQDGKESYYLIVSAFAPYKKVDIAVQAFNETGLPLKIIGKGQEEKRLKKMAKSNIEFLGWKSNDELKSYYQSCMALIFPGEEDFGIVPVEAMACGKPVVAYRKGGATETVIENETGVFFEPQTPKSLSDAVERCKNQIWDAKKIREYSLKFSVQRFKSELNQFIAQKLQPCV